MIGEAYFETRARIGTALFALTRLARQSGVNPARIVLLQNLVAGLKEPFLFVVAGEVNAGKSSFLNALFGADFCRADVRPTTEQIYLFKYGEESHDLDLGDSLVECYRKYPFLKDYNLVDTPGTNSIADQHQVVTERFLPMADLVIFVFSVTNPWGATTWEFLEKIHSEWGKSVVFVLQQCDLRSETEVQAIIEHMKLTAKKRLGRSFPIFAVSARDALLAKTSGVDKDRLWQSSRFQGLEDHISQAVTRTDHRVRKMQNTLQAASVVLTEIERKTEGLSNELRTDRQWLATLDKEVAEQKQRTLHKLGGLYRWIENRQVELQVQGSDFLAARLGIFSSVASVFRSDRETAELVNQGLAERVIGSVRDRTGEASAIVEDDMRHLWQQLGEPMEKHYGVRLETGGARGPDWAGRRKALADQMIGLAQNHVRNLNVAELLHHLVRKRRRLLVFFALLIVVGAAATGAAAYGQLFPHILIAAAACGFSIVLGGVYAMRSSAAIVDQFAQSVEDKRTAFQEELKSVFTRHNEAYFSEFLKIFQPLRDRAEETRQRNEPQVMEIENLRKALVTIGEELDVNIA